MTNTRAGFLTRWLRRATPTVEASPSIGHVPMKLIVGLGNPGRKYEQTRHNVGFMAAAKLASLIGAGPSKSQFLGEIAEGLSGTEKLIVLWPQTFMNASGKSVRKAFDFYKMSADDLLVICDDLDLACGRLRIRATGSAGGQKGVADIIRHLGTDEFTRLKIGIGRPPPEWDVADYVLGKVSKDEQDKIEAATNRAAKAAIDWAKEGTRFAMNQYNADPDAKSKTKPKKQNAKQKPSPEQDPNPADP